MVNLKEKPYYLSDKLIEKGFDAFIYESPLDKINALTIGVEGFKGEAWTKNN